MSVGYSGRMRTTRRTRVKDAADATERAMQVLRQHYRFVYPVQAKRAGDYWLVDVDVGIAKAAIVRARVNAVNGEIVDYGRVSEDGA